MTVIKFLGLNKVEELRFVQIALGSADVLMGYLHEIPLALPEDGLWVVCRSSAEAFEKIAASYEVRPKAIVWVPLKQSPLSCHEYSGLGFEAQLKEADECDRNRMERISRCVQVLQWGMRVTDVPAHWFAGLSGKPRTLGASALPFSDEEKQHLRECIDCLAEAYQLLEGRIRLASVGVTLQADA